MKNLFLVVFGTRPEALKLIPIIKELHLKKKNYKTCFIGQHKELAKQVLNLFNIRCNFNLSIMKKDQKISGIGIEIFKKFEKLIKKIKPDKIIIQGDTSTAMFCALVAFYNNVEVVHIEAGLRTNDNKNPFPEELNRQIISKISSLNFAPTILNLKNLQKEKVPGISYIVGNTIIDMVQYYKKLNYKSKLKIPNKNFFLVTLHRRENFIFLSKYIQFIKYSSKHFKKFLHVIIVHPNPNVSKIFYKKLKKSKNILLLKPVNYFESLFLQQNAKVVFTDSGGIQEEAITFGTPVIIFRRITERIESLGLISHYYKSNNYDNVKLIEKILKKKKKPRNFFGNGLTAQQVVKKI
jgi:UDP-N-acetylglucosamine 2-epimerase (non-hydrolysing)